MGQIRKKTDKDILRTYLPKTKDFNERIFNELVEKFKHEIEEELKGIKYKFKEFRPKDYTFEFDYFYENNFIDEEWKQIGNLNYQISNYGRIKNIQTKKLKSLKKQRFGMQVILWQNSQSYTVTISRLVAHMFIRKVNEDERVSHINGNIRDNYYKNLKIVSK